MKCRNSVHQPLLWQLIAKYRKRRLALHTALRTVYQRRQLLLRVASLTVPLLENNNGAAVLRWSRRLFQRNVGWFTKVWSTYSEKRFKEAFRISRSTFMFLLCRIRNAIEKDTITVEPISPEARLAICLYRLARGDYYLNSRVFLSRNYRLIVAQRKFDVLKTNICPRSEASRANMLVLRASNFQGATIRPIVPRHKHSIVFIVHY